MYVTFLGESRMLKRPEKSCNIMKLIITEKSCPQPHTSLMDYAFLLSSLTSFCNNVAAFVAQKRQITQNF